MIKWHRMAVAASLCACNESGAVGTAANHAAATNETTRKSER
jgi:hypothetical protein